MWVRPQHTCCAAVESCVPGPQPRPCADAQLATTCRPLPTSQWLDTRGQQQQKAATAVPTTANSRSC